MKEFFKGLWLVLFGLNIGLFCFSIAFHQYNLAILNILSAISFLISYSIHTDKDEDSASKKK